MRVMLQHARTDMVDRFRVKLTLLVVVMVVVSIVVSILVWVGICVLLSLLMVVNGCGVLLLLVTVNSACLTLVSSDNRVVFVVNIVVICMVTVNFDFLVDAVSVLSGVGLFVLSVIMAMLMVVQMISMTVRVRVIVCGTA